MCLPAHWPQKSQTSFWKKCLPSKWPQKSQTNICEQVGVCALCCELRVCSSSIKGFNGCMRSGFMFVWPVKLYCFSILLVPLLEVRTKSIAGYLSIFPIRWHVNYCWMLNSAWVLFFGISLIAYLPFLRLYDYRNSDFGLPCDCGGASSPVCITCYTICE